MDKSTKTFKTGEILYAKDLNAIVAKVNEIVAEVNKDDKTEAKILSKLDIIIERLTRIESKIDTITFEE